MTEKFGGDAANSISETQPVTSSNQSRSNRDCGDPVVPLRLGRYLVRGKLGRGGFADVFLAHDEELERHVALKVPRADQFGSDKELQAFIDEARTSAHLQHPGIVTVFDVGSHEGTPFIVLEYIRGRSLSRLLENEPITSAVAAGLMMDIAEAIAHAHDRGFTHRDIKPQNVLLDEEDRPHIADFGLAVRHLELTTVESNVAGTTSYMAPEQVRGEAHRIDARTDIWALGVVFYQMLTRHLPFVGSTRTETYQRILYSDPVPPRQWSPTIPAELERVCLRCLCRQMSDRYRRARDLADDLAEWIQLSAAGSGSSARRRPGYIEPPNAAVVPRGLRSFEREDGDFFLRLLPGPRDRDGLPAGVRFWKNRIEERDPDETFAVGVLYGPSGCGKSSLVKAGLLPRLGADVISIYIDATPTELESRLLKALRKACSRQLVEPGLDEALRRLRESPELRGAKKVLILLDQFEQWLHHWQSGERSELVRALRQCDGQSVQAILMVRDDFWIPVARLMHYLEVGIVEGVNGMLVDSFDSEHARRVMNELGVAYGRLSADSTQQSSEQAAFLDRAVSALTEEGRLYPVRLAIFVEMIKDREWVPSMLDEVGGTEGVGVAFLENSVGARSSPARRIHEPAVRHLLAALLPTTGQIKDQVRRRSELLESSPYRVNLREFDAVIRMLDLELRLITPAQSLEGEPSSDSHEDEELGNPDAAYQLTHDFLIPSIREWLDRHARGSRKGRAQLLLQEQAALWNSRPSPRYLPSPMEWLGISWQTSHREWTMTQRRMMRAATQRILRGTLTAAVLLVIVLASVWIGQGHLENRRHRNEAERLASKLQDVTIADVPRAIEEMKPHRPWIDPHLRSVFEDPSEPARRRVRAGLALLPIDSSPVRWLVQQLTDVQTSPDDFLIIRDALVPHQELAREVLHQDLSAVTTVPRVRFRIACALAGLDADRSLWSTMGPEVAASLLREPNIAARTWISALRKVGDQLRDPLHAALESADSLESARTGALALFELGGDDRRVCVERLIDALVRADGPRYRAIKETLQREPELSRRALRGSYEQQLADERPARDPANRAAAIGNLVLAIWEFGDDEPLRDQGRLRAEPYLRTRLIHSLAPDRVDLARILPLVLQSDLDDPQLNVALIATTFHLDAAVSHEVREQLLTRLRELYRDSPDPEVHAATHLLLQRFGEPPAAMIPRESGERDTSASRRWFVNRAGMTMIILDPGREEGRADQASEPSEPAHRFAISTTEVPLEIFLQFDASHQQAGVLREPSNKTPVTDLLVLQMAAFCNWLSARDGIPADQWCYPPAEEMNVAQCHAVPGATRKSGYRLPSVAEWEWASGCGSTASRFYGDDPKLMRFYAWEQSHSARMVHKVSELLPNPFGLQDVYGNVEEVCVVSFDAKTEATPEYVAKGGSSLRLVDSITTQGQRPADYRLPSEFVGFRVVRTVPAQMP